MTDSTAHLRRKIDSAADLQSVVRAMKAQAAASVGQYAQSVAALGDYAHTVELGLSACFRQDLQAAKVGVKARAPQRSPIRAVVFGSDQGLVGRFNDSIAAYALQTLPAAPAGVQVWAVGERVHASLADSGLPALGLFAVPASIRAVTRLVTELLVKVVDTRPGKAALGDGSDAGTGADIGAGAGAVAGADSGDAPTPDLGADFELHLFYNRPTGGAGYVPVAQRLLPLDEAWALELARRPWPTALPPQVVGSRSATVRALISEYLYVSIFRASAESLASENASRLAAMDRADRNIDKMLSALHEGFHRLRQSKIDEELSDVISGFKALNRSTKA